MADLYEEKVWLKNYPEGYPHDLDIPAISAIDMFEDGISSNHGSPAVHYFDTTFTYGELNSLADSMAAGLSDLGIKKGDRVITQLQSIPQALITLYGCWKLGAILVPLNPMYKERELEFYYKDSGARVFIAMEACYPEVRKLRDKTSLECVITTSELDFLPPEYPAAGVFQNSKKEKFSDSIDMMDFLNRYKDAGYSRAEVTPEDIAYLIYTSGTTGPPKGAMSTHGNVVAAAYIVRTVAKLSKADRILALAPFIHVTGTSWHLAAASLVGIPVIIVFRFEPGEVLRLIEKWKPTQTVAPQTAFISLLGHPDLKRRDISSLKKIWSGGSPVAEGFVQRFEQATGVYILSAYGLTESTSPNTVGLLELRSPVDQDSKALSVGLPVPNCAVKVVDAETGVDLPPGKEGEIAVKGPMIVPGYWEKPEETANAIRDGWLYTGDIGKMDENGWFYVIDRKKDLIIASGYNIWPREVEDTLYLHPAVKEACVVGIPDPYRGETVKAFVVLNEEYKGKVTPEELVEFCRGKMAAYKYPRIVEIIPEIPKTASGKLLRRLLREAELKKNTD